MVDQEPTAKQTDRGPVDLYRAGRQFERFLECMPDNIQVDPATFGPVVAIMTYRPDQKTVEVRRVNTDQPQEDTDP